MLGTNNQRNPNRRNAESIVIVDVVITASGTAGAGTALKQRQGMVI
jgi:hypothetical protein